MITDSNGVPGHEWSVEVADLSLVFRDIKIAKSEPTGAELALAAVGTTEPAATVLEVLANGELNEIRLDEPINLQKSTRKFVIAESDRSYKLTINELLFEWPCRIVSGGQLRKLGKVPPDDEIYLDLPDKVERIIREHDLVDLDSPGVEKFKSRARHWKLNVQGVVLTVNHPTIVVRQAINDAGFDPDKNWIIILRVRDHPKKEVGLDYVVDLRTPGIEKIRLTPREVNNGEGPSAPRRKFALLDVDVRFLDCLGLFWETVIDDKRRWLLIHDYPVPPGFTAERVLLALEIPTTYPGAQIDMFYTNPPLGLRSGRPIDRANVNVTILGAPFTGWSRHRGAQSPWNPASDNVSTHLALVESAMAKEVGE